jgi:glycine/D-amino acid oxidase-like deaminating enzyme
MRSYEYVVVGAGTAGCVLAARLSEDGVRVLPLEAGGAQALEAMAVPGGRAADGPRDRGRAGTLAVGAAVMRCPDRIWGDPDDLRSYVRTNLRSYSHYAGTCATVFAIAEHAAELIGS